LPDTNLAPLPRRVALATILGAFWTLAILPGLYIASFSVMAADAPGSHQNPAIVTFIYACWAFPLLAVFAALGGLIGALKGWSRLTAITSVLPLVAVVVAVSALAIWARQS
jgi:hypothetical protein